ncbi:hypothetical protein CMV_002873 [Castanea mollissima]|uniref:Uncharacterized protein n=1 Tax=Castanea mollissima TaxID=60419 RepID=A0A8J4RPN9_9ROSI|nr:hypothetical protein CMV_002873 [Castanea mollissima]
MKLKQKGLVVRDIILTQFLFPSVLFFSVEFFRSSALHPKLPTNPSEKKLSTSSTNSRSPRALEVSYDFED